MFVQLPCCCLGQGEKGLKVSKGSGLLCGGWCDTEKVPCLLDAILILALPADCGWTQQSPAVVRPGGLIHTKKEGKTAETHQHLKRNNKKKSLF